MVGTNDTLVPTLKMYLKSDAWKKWQQAKIDIAAGRNVNNADALNELIKVYNREKGRKLI